MSEDAWRAYEWERMQRAASIDKNVQVTAPTCYKCKHALNGGAFVAECHRNAPVITATQGLDGQWPRVAYGDVCGQFEPFRAFAGYFP